MLIKNSKIALECQQKRKDCFAYDSGMCKVLQDTTFDKICPFYKTKVSGRTPNKVLKEYGLNRKGE